MLLKENGYKLIKDPIYGYIEVDNFICETILDTPTFQRLRDIRQTSYLPLYPSSHHNRFVHSLGVYFLGRKASSSLATFIKLHMSELGLADVIEPKEIDKMVEIFNIACLLHDVGHAPFSHLGENFFKSHKGVDIDEQLETIVNSKQITSFKKEGCIEAAAHEVISCIIAYNTYSDYLEKLGDFEFFSRCITGYLYDASSLSEQEAVKNCFIQLLNSKTIDVDRLDYVIRDAFCTGFKSVEIDYERLLNGICAIKNAANRIELAFDTTALSVIENVIYAHDVERKWIQQQHVILYENYILNYAMSKLNDMYPTLFTVDMLQGKGGDIEINGTNIHINYLSDTEVLFLIKNYLNKEPLIEEYLDRNKRRHAIWKSEAEYRTLFYVPYGTDGLVIKNMETEFTAIEKWLMTLDVPIVDKSFLPKLESEKNKAEKNLKENSITQDDYIKINKKVMWIERIQKIFSEQGLDFDFVILGANKFQSNFSKADLKNINIYFKATKSGVKLEKVSTILTSKVLDPDISKNMFYIYYNRKNNVDKEAFSTSLFKASLDIR